MTTSEKDFIVAIELGSSKICGIAGRKKDGTMQILAYAEEKTAGSVKRGIVYNIEKTYQSVSIIIQKLEAALKTKVARVYVGMGGQSVRSYKCIVSRDLLTQSCITNEVVDAMREESYEIPYNDYEVLENIPQEYEVDGHVVSDPVGVMGVKVQGGFVDVIAKNSLRTNAATVFDNAGVEVVEELITPLKLADKVLTDSEKRSGCALVDLGAETTTVVVYKGNLVRYMATIPLGSNNINKDLTTVPVDETEAEDVKLTYGDACPSGDDIPDENQHYTTSDGRQLAVSLLQDVAEFRMGEIIANVVEQLVKSNYSETLLAGLVLTGGGANMKNILEAFKVACKDTKVEKVRVANKVNQMVVKASNINFNPECPQSLSALSLLLSGTMACGGEQQTAETPDLFGAAKNDDEQRKRMEEVKAARESEDRAAAAFEEMKNSIRAAYDKVGKQIKEIERYGSDKKVREASKKMSLNILDETIGEKYEQAKLPLQGKDRYRQTLKESADLETMLKEAVDDLINAVNKANKENSLGGKFGRWVKDLVTED